MALLDVQNLKLYFFTRRGAAKAVDDVSFGIEKNETMGLIGESGCGKTTAALTFMRFVKKPGKLVGGHVYFEGRDIATASEEEMRKLRGKEISIVRQEAQNALNPVLRIGKQITEMILEHENVSNSEAMDRAKEQLNLVGINEKRINCYPHEFSGGMKQRAMVAIATACNPKFLILDEPTTGLDVIVQRQLLMMINDLREKLHLTAIFISHDLAVIAETCDKVAVMYAGKIVEMSDVVTMYKDPLHPYSKALIGAYPSLKGAKRKLYSIPGAPPGLINPPEGCRFAPRCEYAMDICTKEEPLMVEKEGRKVACHLIK
ncbi:MAG: ABC transporter ATP-binding protein [Desulfobacterales bacterium]|nr:ABC transporter ATP-binding protein [Desulfobacterales bacterium]